MHQHPVTPAPQMKSSPQDSQRIGLRNNGTKNPANLRNTIGHLLLFELVDIHNHRKRVAVLAKFGQQIVLDRFLRCFHIDLEQSSDVLAKYLVLHFGV
jgi:hypothetical protein